VKTIPTAGELVTRFSAEYEQAKRDLEAKTALTAGRASLAAE
jgi:hypothetical protein